MELLAREKSRMKRFAYDFLRKTSGDSGKMNVRIQYL